MSAQTQNSIYKKRVISAMLETNGTSESRLPPTRSGGDWPRRATYGGVALALSSALAVFFLLYHRDSSAAVSALVSRPSVVTAPAAPASAIPEAAKTEAAPAATEAKVNDGSEPLSFRIRRSRAYQTVGPVALRLVRVDLRRHVCDVGVQMTGRRVFQRRFFLDRALQIKSSKPPTSLELTVSTINRDSIAGTLTEVPADAVASSNIPR